MELFNETKQPLAEVWNDNKNRQAAKLVIAEAIGLATELTVKQAQNVMVELDQLLLDTKEEDKKQVNPGL